MSEIKWQITMLGPSRVGKTSLVTALQLSAKQFFRGTAISVEAVDKVTRDAFRHNNDQMTGELAARRFSPDSLPGDEEEHEYQLAVDPGVKDIAERQILSFIDYPGGWISDGEHESIVREHLANSPAVIIPIDATLIMSARSVHMGHVATALELDAVADHVRLWAKTRREEGDPTRLVLAPIKCESYFNDNGGRVDQSETLLQRTRALYHDVVSAYRDEAGSKAPVLYAPVDTIGPIEIMDVQWSVDAGGHTRMTPTYRVRTDVHGRPATRSVRGAEPILAHLVRDLVELREQAIRQERSEAEKKVKDLKKEEKKRRSGWWSRMWDNLSGASERRKSQTKAEKKRIEQLDDGLQRLARNVDGATREGDWNRVQEW